MFKKALKRLNMNIYQNTLKHGGQMKISQCHYKNMRVELKEGKGRATNSLFTCNLKKWLAQICILV